jgi:uncharacterized protein
LILLLIFDKIHLIFGKGWRNKTMPNHLIDETSPYLLQHAHNPVDWYPWGPEVLQKAREENRPIFLSIGYAACHWCHVMEHESFEDPETARLLNDYFVSIKVDREERPDLDGIYMNAVVMMTGQGGWPMSLFLTPEGEPFYGGTYFPPTRRHGMPAFREVLTAVAKSWANERGEIRRVGSEVAQHLKENNAPVSAASQLRPNILQQVTQALLGSYDWTMGGWGRAPRFPQPMAIEFLLQQATRGNTRALEAASHALERMSQGGMYDVVGGGFHRYSTDDDWLVPHFEKMLYDNGQLALAYLHAYLLTGKAGFRQVCTETLDFISRELTHSAGGFCSSLDADSEGQEGKYYIWSPAEVEAALPDPTIRALFDQVYTVTPQGNFEGHNILQRKSSLEELAGQLGLHESELIQRLDSIHKRLYTFREQRVRPATDDKVLVSWNSLALRAFAQAGRYLQRSDYLAIARQNAGFLLDTMYSGGHLLRAWRNGQGRHSAFLEDHAGLALALLDLYQSDPDPRWYQAALQLAGDMLAHFRDPQGGFFDTRSDQEALITRPKELQDNATPSGSALAASALLHLSAYNDQSEWRSLAENVLTPLQDLLVRHPTAFGFWLQGLDFAVGPVKQIAVIGPLSAPATRDMLEEIWRTYRPRSVVAVSAQSPDLEVALPALLQERGMIQDKPTAYVCQGFVCDLPVTTPETLKPQLDQELP